MFCVWFGYLPVAVWLPLFGYVLQFATRSIHVLAFVRTRVYVGRTAFALLVLVRTRGYRVLVYLHVHLYLRLPFFLRYAYIGYYAFLRTPLLPPRCYTLLIAAYIVWFGWFVCRLCVRLRVTRFTVAHAHVHRAVAAYTVRLRVTVAVGCAFYALVLPVVRFTHVTALRLPRSLPFTVTGCYTRLRCLRYAVLLTGF